MFGAENLPNDDNSRAYWQPHPFGSRPLMFQPPPDPPQIASRFVHCLPLVSGVECIREWANKIGHHFSEMERLTRSVRDRIDNISGNPTRHLSTDDNACSIACSNLAKAIIARMVAFGSPSPDVAFYAPSRLDTLIPLILQIPYSPDAESMHPDNTGVFKLTEVELDTDVFDLTEVELAADEEPLDTKLFEHQVFYEFESFHGPTTHIADTHLVSVRRGKYYHGKWIYKDIRSQCMHAITHSIIRRFNSSPRSAHMVAMLKILEIEHEEYTTLPATHTSESYDDHEVDFMCTVLARVRRAIFRGKTSPSVMIEVAFAAIEIAVTRGFKDRLPYETIGRILDFRWADVATSSNKILSAMQSEVELAYLKTGYRWTRQLIVEGHSFHDTLVYADEQGLHEAITVATLVTDDDEDFLVHHCWQWADCYSWRPSDLQRNMLRNKVERAFMVDGSDDESDDGSDDGLLNEGN